MNTRVFSIKRRCLWALLNCKIRSAWGYENATELLSYPGFMPVYPGPARYTTEREYVRCFWEGTRCLWWGDTRTGFIFSGTLPGDRWPLKWPQPWFWVKLWLRRYYFKRWLWRVGLRLAGIHKPLQHRLLCLSWGLKP